MICYYGATGRRKFLFNDDPKATRTLKCAMSDVGMHKNNHMYSSKFMCKITFLKTENLFSSALTKCIIIWRKACYRKRKKIYFICHLKTQIHGGAKAATFSLTLLISFVCFPFNGYRLFSCKKRHEGSREIWREYKLNSFLNTKPPSIQCIFLLPWR